MTATEMRRPSSFAPLSVTFATGKTGTRLQHEYGAEGLGVWAALLAAAKRNQGLVTFAHDTDWQALGIFSAPSFTLRAFLKTTGNMKQTRTTTHGHVMYVQITHYTDWNNDAHRGFDRERKTRKADESNRNNPGSEPEANWKVSATELELEEELTKAHTSKTDVRAADQLDTEKTLELSRIIEQLHGVNGNTWTTLEPLAAQVPLSVLADLRTRSTGKGTGWIVRALRSEIAERAR